MPLLLSCQRGLDGSWNGPCQSVNQSLMLRPLARKLSSIPGFVIVKVKPRRDGAPEQRKGAARYKSRTLPNISRHNDLRPLALLKILPEAENLAGTPFHQLQHFDRVATIEMEKLIGLQAMHLTEIVVLQQVLNCGAYGAGTGIACVQKRARVHGLSRLVRPDIPAALTRMRHQAQRDFYIFCSHAPDAIC